MKVLFDDIVFLISTDCFGNALFGEFPKDSIETIKSIARTSVLEIIDGGDNYYLCADFGKTRVDETKTSLFAKIRDEKIELEIIKKIEIFYSILENTSEGRGKIKQACRLIGSIGASLRQLDFDNFKTSILNDTIEIAKKISLLEICDEPNLYEWGKIWLKSPSKWDRFTMSLMDEIPEMPYNKFREIKRLFYRFDFLYEWKKHLSKNDLKTMKIFITNEVYAMLAATNFDIKTETDRIISTL